MSSIFGENALINERIIGSIKEKLLLKIRLDYPQNSFSKSANRLCDVPPEMVII